MLQPSPTLETPVRRTAACNHQDKGQWIPERPASAGTAGSSHQRFVPEREQASLVENKAGGYVVWTLWRLVKKEGAHVQAAVIAKETRTRFDFDELVDGREFLVVGLLDPTKLLCAGLFQVDPNLWVANW